MSEPLIEQPSTPRLARAEQPKSNSTWVRRLWYSVAKLAVRCGFVLCYRVRYSGLENVPLEGGALVVANHQSHFDPPVVGAGFPRQMSFLARHSLFHSPQFGWLIRSLNAIPLDREGGGMAGMKETLRQLKRGEAVLIFPEGTRSSDGQMAPFRAGFATLALRAKATLVPVSIVGAFEAWPRQRRFPGPGRIHVHFGLPLSPEQLQGRPEAELVAEVQSRVQAGVELIRRRPVFAPRPA